MITVSYTATAGQTDFSVTFPFIKEAHLRVYFDDVLLADADWDLTGESTVVLQPSVVVLEGSTVRIDRVTPNLESLVDFQAATPIRRTELSLMTRQLLYILQEEAGANAAALTKNTALTAWLAEGLPVKNAGGPTDADDLATKAYVDQGLAGDGILPTPTVDDVGKGLRVRATGSGPAIQIGAVAGAVKTFKVLPQDPVGEPVGALTGYPLDFGGIGILNWSALPATRVPLGVESGNSFLTPDGGEISLDVNTFDVLVPRGKFEIVVEGTVRNLISGAATNQAQIAAALTNETGAEVFDQTYAISLGRPGGMTDPLQVSANVALYTVLDNTVPRRVNLRLSSNINAPEIVADVPFRVRVREVPQ